MPIYEYRCLECGKTFDSIQKFSDEAYTECGQSTVECPKDGHGKVERLLSSPSFHFKGSGFYITDYNKGSGGAKTPAAASSSPGAAESKPAASTTSDATPSSSSTAKKDS